MKGKFEKKNGTKSLILLLVLVLLVGCLVGGTVAWLMTQTDAVTNTFVAGNIGTLTLKEDNETDADGKEYLIVPGLDIPKDPVISFSGNNVAAYVFVKVNATGWTLEVDGTTYTYTLGNNEEMSWTVADGWIRLNETDHIYYREVVVDTDTATVSDNEKYHIIKDDKITVSSAITQEQIGAFTQNLTFQAYAIQQSGSSNASEAWTKLNG